MSREIPETIKRMPGGLRVRGPLRELPTNVGGEILRMGRKTYLLSSYGSRRGRDSFANSTTMLRLISLYIRDSKLNEIYLVPLKAFPLKL